MIAIGAWMLWQATRTRREGQPHHHRRGLALIALGISISLDELAIGFSIGLAPCPSLP